MEVRFGPIVEGGETPWVDYCLISLVALGVIVNLSVICKVGCMAKLKRRRGAIPLLLVIHLAVVTICIAANVLLNTLENLNPDLISGRKYYPGGRFPTTPRNYCGLWKYWQSILMSIFAMNVVEIIHERIKCSEVVPINLRPPEWIHLPAAFWSIALLFSIPTGYMYIGNADTGKCETIQLWKNLEVTSFYLLARFQVFHIFMVAYITHALVKIYSKIRRVHNVYHCQPLSPPPRGVARTHGRGSQKISSEESKRSRGVYFVFAYLATYIVLWFCAGFYFFVETLREVPLHSDGDSGTTDPPRTPSTPIYHLIIYGYMFLTPYMNLRLIEGVSWCTCGRGSISAYPLDPLSDDDEPEKSQSAPEELVIQSTCKHQNYVPKVRHRGLKRRRRGRIQRSKFKANV